MSNLSIDIAKAVAVELNEGTFSDTFTAAWKPYVKFSLQSGDLDSVQVSVAVKARTTVQYSREVSQNDVSIMIGVQKKVGKDRDVDIIAPCDLVEEIIDHMAGRALADVPYARFVSIENDPIYDSVQLIEDGVFTSVLTIVYMAMKG